MFEGVYAATTTPFREDGSVDFDLFGKHCAWLADEGVAGLTPNGSLGEYETLTEAERAQIVTVAIEAVGGRIAVVPGVSGKSARRGHPVGRAGGRGRRGRGDVAGADVAQADRR